MSLAKRLKGAQSFKAVLYEQLSAIEQARETALQELGRLTAQTAGLEPAFVEQVGNNHKQAMTTSLQKRIAKAQALQRVHSSLAAGQVQ